MMSVWIGGVKSGFYESLCEYFYRCHKEAVSIYRVALPRLNNCICRNYTCCGT